MASLFFTDATETVSFTVWTLLFQINILNESKTLVCLLKYYGNDEVKIVKKNSRPIIYEWFIITIVIYKHP